MMTQRLTLLAALVATTAVAQTAVPSFELERLRLNPGARDGLLVGGGDVLPEGRGRVSLTGHYEHDPLVFRGGDGTVLARVVGSRVTAHIAGAWSPLDWLELGLQLPIVVYQGNTSGLGAVAVTAPDAAALGTPYVQARFGILRERAGSPLDVAVGLGLGVPLGSEGALTRDPTVTFIPSVGVGKTLGDVVRLGVDLGATVRGEQALSPSRPDARDVLGSQFDLGVGVSTLGEGLRGEASVRTSIPFTKAPTGTELMLGGRYPLGDFEVYALAGPGFGRLPGTPTFRALLGVAWAGGGATGPACVEGKPYALADCPDLDFDGDGIVNAVDACPKVKGAASADGCPDADGDGITDAEDRCPNERGPVALRGCPDSDSDGLADIDDACPAEAGPLARKGCPPKDSDGDGLIDEEDGCPTEPGPIERKGCPIRDTDGDGTPDELDNCPKVAGPVENQGCPAEEKQLIVITRDKLVIKEKVYFDTAKASIQKRSFKLLDQVARILSEHTEVQRVRVEGHTDSRGKHDMNVRLSQARAEAVKKYLVGKGIAETRLEAQGFGPDRPVADNGTAAGREQNRRVEFVIVSPEKVQTHTVEPR